VSNPDPETPLITVSHASASVSQLDTAISLWFTEGDPISIHTLAWASLQLLHDQGLKVGKPSELMLRLLKLTKKERRRAGFVTAIGKHADRRFSDYNTVEYSSGITEEIMYEAACCCWRLFDDLSPWMRLFTTRYIAENPELFKPELPTLLERLGGQEHLARLSRHEFAEEVVPVLSREDFWFPPPSEQAGDS
jgi:hypothetical protein